MKEIHNADGRLVCKADPKSPVIEIKVKDCITTIRFLPNGEIEVTNTKIAA